MGADKQSAWGQLVHLRVKLLGLPKRLKQLMMFALDLAICALAVVVAFFLRLGVVPASSSGLVTAVWTAVALGLVIFPTCRLYTSAFRRTGQSVFDALSFAIAIYGIVYSSIFLFYGVAQVPRTVGLIQPLLVYLGVLASRTLAARLLRPKRYRKGGTEEIRALIYGAGSSGLQLAEALNFESNIYLVGFIDDDKVLQNRRIDNMPVFGTDNLEELIESENIQEIYLAIPSSTRQRRREIVSMLGNHSLRIRTIPGIGDLASGRVTITDMQELDIDDLLGRSPTAPDPGLLDAKIFNCVILVTGAGGSIGSELCRQIVTRRPRHLLLLEMNEYALYAIHQELTALAPEGALITPLLGSVVDATRMRSICENWTPHTIFHAAAYKHVPLVEHNIVEGIRNNVMGTLTLARAAEDAGTRDFVLISTDKAVRPTNIMGATKRLAEMTLQILASEGSATCFSMVRFGNVLGSSGSVVPLFRKQIANGGPVTITHADITRYFMTIPEAAQLVIQAAAMARGGEVFVLDMGEPVRIKELAETMIRLSGLTVRDEDTPEGDIEIVEVGLRPGEKLYEELLIGNTPSPTKHSRIFQAHEKFLPPADLWAGFREITRSLEAGDPVRSAAILSRLVEEYKPAPTIVDWVHSAQVQLTKSD